MAIDEGDCMVAITTAEQTVAQCVIVVPEVVVPTWDMTITEDVPPGIEVKRHNITIGLRNAPLDLIGVTIALHEGDAWAGCLVIVIMVPVVETVTLIITEAVVANFGSHPLEISLEHILNVHIVMTPVACAIPVGTIIFGAGSFTVVIACGRIGIHLIVLTDIRSIGLELTIRRKVKFRESKPTISTCTVVDHDIRHHFRTYRMDGVNQFFQFRLRAPVGILVTIVFGMITHSISVS